MNIRYNGERLAVENGSTLIDFLHQHLDDSERILSRSVIAINQHLIPQHEYHCVLQQDDEIELLTAVVGG